MAGLAVRGPRRFCPPQAIRYGGRRNSGMAMKRVINRKGFNVGLAFLSVRRGGQAVMASGTRAQEGLAVRVSRVMAKWCS